jgi:hypothetical protein
VFNFLWAAHNYFTSQIMNGQQSVAFYLGNFQNSSLVISHPSLAELKFLWDCWKFLNNPEASWVGCPGLPINWGIETWDWWEFIYADLLVFGVKF